ncbi:MAG: hypothetical protein WBB76_00380 [Gaiellaceae bacterium]
MGRWGIALVVATALVVVPSASPQVIRPQTVFHTADLPSDAITAFSVTCPPGYLAVSAGVYTAAPGVTTLSTRPAGLRAYTFRFGNPVTNHAQRVTVAVACRKIPALRSPAPYLRVTPIKVRSLRVGPAGQKAPLLTCPRQTIPAGAGFDLAPPSPGKSSHHFTGSKLIIARQTQSLHDFSFTVRNDGKAARLVDLYGACLTVVRPSGAAGAQLQVKLTANAISVPPGGQIASRSCPSGWSSLATGYSLAPGLSLSGSAAVSGGGRWSVASALAGPATAVLQLVCGRLAAG